MTRPAIFADLDLDAALVEAKAHDQLVLLDATASWCGPCKHMDATTWIDGSVETLLRGRVIAIQLDVDEKKETAQKLGIKAMPTLIAFKNGVEIDRVLGAKAPGELVAWVEGLLKGLTALDAMRSAIATSPNDTKLRMRFAKQLVSSNKLDEATNELAWLWENMGKVEPAMMGIRFSFLANDIGALVKTHPPARARFSALRDAVAPANDATPEEIPLVEWLTLNATLGEPERSVAWMDRARARIDESEKVRGVLSHALRGELVRADRWADLGALLVDPAVEIERAGKMWKDLSGSLPAGIPPEAADQMRAFAVKNLRDTAGLLVRALGAAGRHEEAAGIRTAAAEIDSSPEMAQALAGAPRAST